MFYELLHGFSLGSPREPEPPTASAPARRQFATTRWSLVLAVGRKGTPQSGRALSELCELYWLPVYTFVRRRVDTAEKARELTQGFFTRLLEKDALTVATPDRGRFRSWLMASVKNYLANEWDRMNASSREGSRVHIPLEDAESCLNEAASLALSPEQAFARRWAEKLLAKVLASLCEEYIHSGKGALCDVLKARLTGGEESAYPELAAALGMSAGALRVAAFRFRERYRELLLEEIAHTVERPEDVEDEVRFLVSALTRV
jgi:DNA-directed RNA polymerase specialized sigma24 family protein